VHSIRGFKEMVRGSHRSAGLTPEPHAHAADSSTAGILLDATGRLASGDEKDGILVDVSPTDETMTAAM